MRRFLPILFLTLAAIGANVASADTIAFQEGALLPGGGNYTGTQDTEIAGADPTTSFGTSLTLRADADELGGPVQTLLRFDNLFGALPNQIPLGSTITAAVLTLSAFNTSNSPIGNISLYQLTAAWDETSTWNSMVGGVQIGSETETVPDDSHTVEIIDLTDFDVLASLQAWITGDTNLGWMIENDSTDGVQFRSSESAASAERPRLTVTFTPVPEPGSLTLAGLTAAAALCVRRLRRSR